MNEGRDRVIVLANRAPFKHEWQGNDVAVTRSASGLVTALEPLLERCSGTWVAHAAGSADAQVGDACGAQHGPSANLRYRTRYVAIPEDEFRGYYYGFANEGLWPLCHTVDVTPVFRRADYEMYRAANHRFAHIVADETDDEAPIVLVQDYHFALAPRIVRERLPDSKVIAFWHIPWPRPSVFRACPWAMELLDGLLGSDIVGFQTADDCHNFLGCVEAFADAAVDRNEGLIRCDGRRVCVRAYPVGIDAAHDALRHAPPVAVCREDIRRDLQLAPDTRLGVGVDRMDYTKGIKEKFLAIERLLEMQPDLVGRFAFVQIAEPSRDCLAAYRGARAAALDTCERINQRFAAAGPPPIRFLERHHEPAEVYRYYRAADFCYVGSRHDGMNLVAKEFVSARTDERGVLVLSERAGAAQQLRAALLVNPLQVDQCARAIGQALQMPAIEQATRMRTLRANVSAFDASWWAGEMLADARRLNAQRGARRAAAPQWADAVA